MKSNKYISTLLLGIMWIIFIILGIITKFISEIGYEINDTYSIIIITIMSIFALIAIFASTNTKSQKIIVYSGYCIVLLLLFYDRFVSSLDTTDPDEFHKAALMKANNDYSWNYGAIYTDIISIIYKFFGQQRIIGQFFNLLLIISIEVVCMKIFDNLKINEKNKTIGIALIAFSPNFLLINCTLRREAVIEFILTVSLYCFIEWYRKNKFIYLVESILLSMLVAAFHSGCIAATLGYTLFYMLYDRNKNKLNFKFKNLLVGIVIIILFFILNNYLNGILSSKFQVNSMENYILRMENGKGGAGYSLKAVTTGNTILDLIINSPLRIAYYLISPFPWQWRGIKDIIAFLFSSFYYLIGVILAVHLINDKKVSKYSKNLIIALFLTLCFSYIIFSWGVCNSGTALRHRDKFISIYIVMSVLCIEQKNAKEKYKL